MRFKKIQRVEFKEIFIMINLHRPKTQHATIPYPMRIHCILVYVFNDNSAAGAGADACLNAFKPACTRGNGPDEPGVYPDTD